MWLVDPLLPGEVSFRRRFMITTLVAGCVLSLIMLSHPHIDLELAAVMQKFCSPRDEDAAWCAGWLIELPRRMFMVLFIAGCIAAALLAGMAIHGRKHMPVLDIARCCFLVAVLAMGPGLVANAIFKENWGRARPRTVVELGGDRQFTPPLIPVAECRSNCSFIAGEASSMFALFLGPALLFPAIRISLLTCALAFGMSAGIIRMLQGGHFLSDVLFAGVFMALTAGLLHLVLISMWRTEPRGLGARLGADAAP